jgi:hypothetical protein
VIVSLPFISITHEAFWRCARRNDWIDFFPREWQAVNANQHQLSTQLTVKFDNAIDALPFLVV